MTDDALRPYRGRFAPSPTGLLHFGSLVAALGSYLDACANGGEWLLRIEDVDAPRSVAGAADAILRTLDALGFAWHGEVVFQSQRSERYRQALRALQDSGDVYPCACSRRDVAIGQPSVAIDGGLVYPGTCRNGLPPGRQGKAWRLRVPDCELGFDDRIHGRVGHHLERAVGDFVLRRADGCFAYQLAVVVDDAAQGINAIVRGVDLLDSTPRQIWLQRCLKLPTPSYAHLPLATNVHGDKLSKQTRASPIDLTDDSRQLAAALRFLGHDVADEIARGPRAEFWPWAIAAWSISRVPKSLGICVC